MTGRIIIGIPCRNCGDHLEKVLVGLRTALDRNRKTSILLLDNQSTDSTVSVAKQFACRTRLGSRIKILVNPRNLGYGGSLKRMLAISREQRAAYLMIIHGDSQGDSRQIYSRFFRAIQKNPKSVLVLASRFLSASQLAGYDWERILGNAIFNFLTKLITRVRLSDYGTGIMCLDLHHTRWIALRNLPANLLFHPVLNVMICSRHPGAVVEVPLRWGKAESTSVRLISYGCGYLKFLAKYALFCHVRRIPVERALGMASRD